MTNTTSSPVLVSEIPGAYRPRGLRVDTLDFRLDLIFRSPSDGARDYNKHTRVYDALDVFVPGFSAAESARRLELAEAGTLFTVRDAVLARMQRDAVRAAKVGLLGALPLVVEALVADGHSVCSHVVTARFSHTAGCSCPCSPGFVLDRTVRVTGRPVDLHFATD